MSITFFTADSTGPELNMANGNAARLFDLLGYNVEDACQGGEAAPRDLLGRVLLAQGLLDVATDDEHGRPAVTDGRWFEGGTAPGYLAGRLGDLHKIASWALHRDLAVWWG